MTTRWSKLNIFAVVFFACCVALSLRPETVYADDFGRIVHHIEASYHVHRNYRFLMGFAGIAVKFWHVGGVKSMKIAIFEDQHLDGTDTDRKLDEIIARASQSGWRPMVRSVSRRTGEHVYIYAQDAGKDLKLLVVNVEPNEAEVIQVKVDPKRLEEFIAENTHHSGHHGHETVDGMMSFR
ncbi:MAG TPA: hypothetical protein VJV96_06950 [Candidatus Angelobacter sp.]|jgi:hypothetical protein|nr:hypothetical protein [Candidatus Angelobacter sp.]